MGWQTTSGADVAPDSSAPERDEYGQVFLDERLYNTLGRLNPHLPKEALDKAARKLTRLEGASLEHRNKEFHRMAIEGVTVEYRPQGNQPVRSGQVQVLDFENPTANDWLAVNQFTVFGNKNTRRLDIVLFVNGLPLGVIELKNPARHKATLRSAWQQIQTYKSELPSLFEMNELIVVSDGSEARVGTLTAGWEWFKRWRTIFGEELDDLSKPELLVLLEGICEPERLLRIIRDFIVYEDIPSYTTSPSKAAPSEHTSRSLEKKMAGYHQFHAVQVAVRETLRASEIRQDEIQTQYARNTHPDHTGGTPGDRRIGVVWHTQGSGKSLTMAFYAGAIIRESAMSNPTIVVLTDRNDLDDQLFTNFSRYQDLLRQPPTRAESRSDLRRKLSVESGGVVFTTIQKFFPENKDDPHPTLSSRRNVVVIADEAHRSQYDFIDGYARHMRDALPNASFVGFTATPVELKDANTRAVFGDYISIYDIKRSIEDKATVPIYYESRLVRLAIDEAERPLIDTYFEEVTESEEVERKEKLKTKWVQLEAIVGADNRLNSVASDIVGHFENRLEAIEGKAMVVCMSRCICVKLYEKLTALRPDWHHKDDNRGLLKVVMTGSASDPPDWQPHIRNKQRREALARRFRKPDDTFQIVLVRDMWLTGFDAPSLHTIYLDKPMRGHGLMQAIARVNRVFRDKPGGLVVDYLGLAHELKRALNLYTESGGKGRAILNQDEAVTIMIEKYEVCCGLFHGFNYSDWTNGDSTDRLALLPWALEHILGLPDGKNRLLKAVNDLTKAFALAATSADALQIRDEVSFFQTVRAQLIKRTHGETRPEEELDHAVRQIISRALVSEGVMGVFAVTGLEKPDISLLSEEFLAEIRGMPQPNLAVELLQRLIREELTIRRRKNLVEARSFSEMLEQTLLRYQSRAIGVAQVIEQLIELAKEMNATSTRGEELGLTEEELAFYDALGTSDSDAKMLGDDTLKEIARELIKTMRLNITIDWTMRESERANLRRLVKRVLRRHNYPPDSQEKATKAVMEQTELFPPNWGRATAISN